MWKRIKISLPNFILVLYKTDQTELSGSERTIPIVRAMYIYSWMPGDHKKSAASSRTTTPTGNDAVIGLEEGNPDAAGNEPNDGDDAPSSNPRS